VSTDPTADTIEAVEVEAETNVEAEAVAETAEA